MFDSFFFDFSQVFNAVKLHNTWVALQQIARELRAFTAQVKTFSVATLADLASVFFRVFGDFCFAS